MLSSWIKIMPNDVCEQILKLVNEGITPSQIGVHLRNSCDFGPVLKFNGLASEIPEDLYHLIKQELLFVSTWGCNHSDKDPKFWLILIESRIHRLAKFYKTTEQFSSD
ncbi:40S ribosomal protein S13 [Gigaspora margarita]|uniref:40S ribosomal protein S13 n=1 Tax=Gigaspora margarita TaxID=4874 RepID=A0A8H4AWF0_GIGMA|nr:40S ribosomal protein S13 [Gigaspora margarita]